MTHSTRDPLLVVARVITIALLTAAVVVAALLAACLPYAMLEPLRMLSALLGREVTTVPAGTVAALAGVLSLGFLTVAGAAWFLKQQLDIIGSVSAGDPFAPANADRLSRMGWTVLAIQVLAVPLGLLEYELQDRLEPDEMIMAFSFADNGLILALVLFVLARVFRHGAAMREDLEGTV
jgi:hypothetical protein